MENLFVWLFVSKYTQMMPRKFQNARFEFDKVLTDRKIRQERALYCSAVAQRIMGSAVDKLYVTRNFNQIAKKEVDFDFIN